MDDERRRAIALFRFGVLGALVSARLEHGDRAIHFASAAKRDWMLPDGRAERISARARRRSKAPSRNQGRDVLQET